MQNIRITLLTLVAAMSLPLLAETHKTSCRDLLISEAANDNQVPTSMDRLAMKWLQYFHEPDPNGRLPETIKKWEQWNRITAMQREIALTAELAKLQPEHLRGQVVPSRQWLVEQSEQNLEDLLMHLHQRYPVSKALTLKTEWAPVVNQLVSNINLHFWNYHHPNIESPKDPMVSQHELEKFGIRTGRPNFYASLIGSGRSLGMFVTVAAQGVIPAEFETTYDRHHVHGDSRVIAEQGYVVPSFKNEHEAVKFMDRWHANELHALDNWFEPTRKQEVFATLANQIHKYVLTVKDAETLIQEGMRHFLFYSLASGHTNAVELQKLAQSRYGLQALFQKNFLEFLGWTDMVARIPIGLNANERKILIAPYAHVDTFHSPRQRPKLLPPPKKVDSRRLDEKYMNEPPLIFKYDPFSQEFTPNRPM